MSSLTTEQRYELVFAILSLPQTATQARRDQILLDLGPPISAAVQNDPSPQSHMSNIVAACADYTNGLDKLRFVLEFHYRYTAAFAEVDALLDRYAPRSTHSPMPRSTDSSPDPLNSLQGSVEHVVTVPPLDIAAPGAGASLAVSLLNPELRERSRGAVPPNSRYYIERNTDFELQFAIAKREPMILVRGARQVGRSSLFVRGLEHARQAGFRVANVALEEMELDKATTQKQFLYALACLICERLDLSLEAAKPVYTDAMQIMYMRQFMTDQVLGPSDQHIVLAFDEVEKIFGYPWSEKVFSMLRHWHERGAQQPEEPWKRLTMLLSYSTEPSVFILDSNQSPFNVGRRLIMRDFDQAQVGELNQRYGMPLRTESELSSFFRLLNGHPYLSRSGLDAMAFDGLSLSLLEHEAHVDDGIYSDHLRRVLFLLAQDQALKEVVRNRLLGKHVGDETSFYRLRRAGIMDGDSFEDMHLRCKLYEDYLRRQLL